RLRITANSRLQPMKDIDELFRNLLEISTDEIPSVLSQLGAVSQQLAARLLKNGNGAQAETEDRLLSLKAAAPVLGVSQDWIRDHADSLPFLVRLPAKSGDKVHLRCSAQGLQKWIARRQGR